ncbi:MAG: archease [bacterium]|nr:archease [bacterium]
MRGGHRLLEHTADLCLLAHGPSEEALFEAAGCGLLAVMGESASPGGRRRVGLTARDREGLLVAWLNEIIYLAAAEGGPPAACGVDVVRHDGGSCLEGWVGAPAPWRQGGAEVKAATYHGLTVRPPSAAAPPGVPRGSWWAEIVLDI